MDRRLSQKLAVLAACLALLVAGGAAAALIGAPTTKVFTFTTPGTVVTIPARTFTRTVTVPTITETETDVVTVTTSPTTTATVPTTTSVTPAPGCAKTLAAGGSVASFVASLAAGQTGCLQPGTYTGSFTLTQSNGTASSPVTLTSADPTRPALINGRVVTEPGADYITFSHLRFDWNVGTSGAPSVTIGSANVVFDHDEVTNDNTGICIDLIDSSYGLAVGTVIEYSRIHNCGRLPYGSTNNDHGVYVSGQSAQIHDNWIYDNADRGVQLRGSQNAVVTRNVIDGNGEGVIFGDLDASGNDVYGNIVANSRVRWNAESYWGSTAVGTGNSFHDNCVYPSNPVTSYDVNGGLSGGTGFTATSNRVANPGYAGGGDYTLPAGSACAGYGTAVTPGP